MLSVDSTSKSFGITAEIIRSHLGSAAEEMKRTLIRTAFNPVIYDAVDFGISIYDAKLDLIAEAPGLPLFIGANDYAIKKAVEYVGIENLEEGDILIMNYPYWNAAHTYDVTLFAPVFDSATKQLLAFECIRAHWMDLGAKDPGYVLDSTSVHQEGIIFPGTKVYKRGQPNSDILEMIRFNSRMPDIVIGDLNAQVASIRTGERRLHKIFQKFGVEIVTKAIAQLLDYGERASLDALASLPHGTWSAVDYLDDDGITDELIEMKATVTITGKDFTVDFAGSAGAVKGPVNMPFGATQSMCKVVFKALTTPHHPSNAGNYRPLKVVAPPGTLFHAVYPASTFTLWTGIVALELVYKAVAQGLPSVVSASSGGDVPGFMVVGIHPDTGRFYALGNNELVGWGGTPTHDGADALQHRSSSVERNTPIEVLETRTAMFIERVELRTDSGGPGKYRGGLGARRDIQFTTDAELIPVIKKSRTRPWGLAGGWDSEPNAMYLFVGTERETRVGTRRFTVRKGDRFSVRAAGGGGYGNPKERDPERVLEDVLEGYVSREAAQSVYGVAISGGKVDWEATKKLREV